MNALGTVLMVGLSAMMGSAARAGDTPSIAEARKQCPLADSVRFVKTGAGLVATVDGVELTYRVENGALRLLKLYKKGKTKAQDLQGVFAFDGLMLSRPKDGKGMPVQEFAFDPQTKDLQGLKNWRITDQGPRFTSYSFKDQPLAEEFKNARPQNSMNSGCVAFAGKLFALHWPLPGTSAKVAAPAVRTEVSVKEPTEPLPEPVAPTAPKAKAASGEYKIHKKGNVLMTPDGPVTLEEGEEAEEPDASERYTDSPTRGTPAP